MTKPAGLDINHKPADRFGLLTGLNRSTIKPVKPAGFGFGSTVFKTMEQRQNVIAQFVARSNG
jgi:hypothetical protein